MNKTTRYLGCAAVLLLSVLLTYSSHGDDIERDHKAEELSLIEARPLETLPLALDKVEPVDLVVPELDQEPGCYKKIRKKARGIAIFSLVVTTAAEAPVNARIALTSINIGAHYGACKIREVFHNEIRKAVREQ